MENQTQLTIVLPPEVNDLAVKVSEQKQQEVLSVLNQIFTGTSDWEKQVDAIEVKDINDKMSIQLAEVARKNVKVARLNAEKIFDAKRDEVQQIKAEYDLEDKLWLKAKQVMQIKFKAIEDKAEYKSQFVMRYMAEQRELRTQLRIEKVAKFNPELNRIEFENMNDEMFSIFLAGIEKVYNDRIAAEKKAEEDRIAKEKADREERERMKADNEKLQKEAEARELEMKKEREKAEAARKAAEDKARKEREEAEKKLAEERRIQAAKLAEEQAKAKKEAEAREKIEKELQAKKDAERKAQLDAEIKAAKELEAKQEAEKKAAAAPDKDKLLSFVSGLSMPAMSLQTAYGQTTEKVIREKFEGFKVWAEKEINKPQNTLNL